MLSCKQCGVPLLDDRVEALCDNCIMLRDSPDKLSKRTKIGSIPFQDMKQLDEDNRIKEIVKHIKSNPGRAVLVMVDRGPAYQGKADRYLEKIRTFLPNVRLVDRFNGPGEEVESLKLAL